jgi:tRNA A-37 threonylcarbamoyl transferase component Bud32
VTVGLPQRYRLLGRIGVGGMAEVFRAELVSAEGITRELVIKRVHPRLALDPEAVRRFVDEARVAAKLRHPNVVQVFEFGRTGDHYFLAMELVEGCDLATLLRRAEGGRLAPGVALTVIDALLDGLGYVHALRAADGAPLGLVHRDVSPHNVLLGRAGEVKLADFGIAQASAGGAGSFGAVEGKLAYMAPEQARGDRVDARSDLFSAAAILHEMLTGARVYGAATGDALRERATLGALELAPVDASIAPIEGVLRRALSPASADRYPSASELQEALRAAGDALGLRPDLSALRSLVARDSAPDVAPLQPTDRTLTDAVSSPAAPVARMPGPARPLRKAGRRLLFERVAIALGVLVVSILAERRTRPIARPTGRAPASVRAGRPLRLAMPSGVGAAWWQGALRRRLEAEVDVRVERVELDGPVATARALRSGDVDLALVPSEALRALVTVDAVRRLDTVLPEIDGAGYLALRASLRAESLRWGTSVGAEGEGTYALPVAADLVAFGVSDAARQQAQECVATQRPALDAWLRAHSQLRLPSGASLRRELDDWTSWDLVIASWCWSRRGERLAAVTPDDGAGVGAAVARWGSLGATTDGAVPTAEALAGAREATSVLAAMGAIGAPGPASSERTAVARWASLSWWSGHRAEGWTLARPPRGDRLTLDALGDPAGEGQRGVVGRTWGWSLGRGSSRTARAARLLLLVARESGSEALVDDLGGASAMARRAPVPGPIGDFITASLEQSPFVRLEGPASLDEAESLPARARVLLAGEH